MSKEIQRTETKSPAVESARARQTFHPATDIVETPESLFVYADMPGVDEKSLDVTVDRNVLTIFGGVAEEAPKQQSLTYAEYNVGDYERVFTLPDEIGRERIEATLKDGVLRLMLPKSGPAKTRKIAVRAS